MDCSAVLSQDSQPFSLPGWIKDAVEPPSSHVSGECRQGAKSSELPRLGSQHSYFYPTLFSPGTRRTAELPFETRVPSLATSSLKMIPGPSSQPALHSRHPPLEATWTVTASPCRAKPSDAVWRLKPGQEGPPSVCDFPKTLDVLTAMKGVLRGCHPCKKPRSHERPWGQFWPNSILQSSHERRSLQQILVTRQNSDEPCSLPCLNSWPTKPTRMMLFSTSPFQGVSDALGNLEL